MSSDRDSSAGEGQRDRAFNRILGLLMLICLAMAATSLAGLSCVGRRALDRQLESIRASGEPATMAELYASLPEIPDEANSALMLLDLDDQLRSILPHEEWWERVPLASREDTIRWGQAWPEEVVCAATYYLSEIAPVLARIDRIHDMPDGRFPVEFDASQPILPQLKGGAAPGPYAARLASDIEALAAMRDALRGSPKAGLRRVETIVNIGASLTNDASLVSFLSALAIGNVATQTSEFVLSTAQATPTELVELEQLFERAERQNVVLPSLYCLRFELRAIVTEMFRKGDFGWGIASIEVQRERHRTAKARKATWTLISTVAPGWFEQNEAKMLELLDPIVRAGNRAEDALAAARVYEQQVQNLGKYYVFAFIAMPSLERPMELWARHDARLRCTRAALAAERFRIDTGDWPETLDHLVPDYIDAVPSDPFAGAPVRYAQRDGGIVVYSVAENGIDDGGELEVKSPKKARPRDVGFRMAAPDERIVRISTP